jgi:hypothetical protein
MRIITSVIQVVMMFILFISCDINVQKPRSVISISDFSIRAITNINNKILIVSNNNITKNLDCDFIEMYNEYMREENVLERLENRFTTTERDKLWEMFIKAYQSKNIVEIDTIEKICLGIDKTSYENEFTLFNIKARDNYIIEVDSYWPERKLGKLALNRIEGTGQQYSVVGNFLMIIQQFIYKTADYIQPTGGDLIREPFNFCTLSFLPIPMSLDIWCIYAQFPKNSFYRDPLTTYCFIKLEEGEYQYDTLTQLTEWSSIDPNKWSTFKCITDVNMDGINDMLIQDQYTSGTYDTRVLNIFTCVDNNLYSIEVENNSFSIGFFDGFVNGRPRFNETCIGYGSWNYKKLREDHAIHNYGPKHSLEIRENGSIYDVTYQNKINLDQDKIAELIANAKHHFDFAYLDVLGHTKQAQEFFLRDKNRDAGMFDDEVWYKIIKDCHERGVPWLVETRVEIPNRFDVLEPWR